MDTTPIFELREQLRLSAIAGAELLSENFRLKKAVGAIEPLKDAAPVFGKIYELSNDLVSGKCEDAPAALLDALALTDSVTVALAGYDVQGELEEIPIEDFSAKITNAPYSKLSVLINALTKSGSGQYNIVSDAVKEKSELFEDYRVKPALVKGLGASYSELADMVYEIIENMGEDMVPLLEKGFDPKGKKETIRRILLIDTLGKEKANDFYLKNIPLAEKNVKKLLVRALRHDVGNADKLIELISTEKGAVKDEAFYTLARLDCDKAREFFEQMEQKKPQETLEYLRFATSDWSSRLAAKIGNRLLDNNDGGSYKTDGYGVHIEYIAFSGKTGKDIADFLRRACEKDGDEQEKLYIREMVDIALMNTAAMTQDKDMCALAMEFAKKYPDRTFSESEFYAMVIGTDDCTDLLKKRILETKELVKNHERNGVAVGSAITNIEDIKLINGKYCMIYKLYDSRDAEPSTHEYYVIPLDQPIREKWIDMLISCDWYQSDLFLEYLFDKDDKDMYEKVKNRYIKKILENEDTTTRLWMMEACGMRNVEGLVCEYYKANHMKFADKHKDAYTFLRYVPADYEYLCKEIDDLESYAKANNITLNLDLEDIREFIEHFWTEQH